MTKKEEGSVVTIDGKAYKEGDLTQKQLILVSHVADLDNKTNRIVFNLDQLKGGRSYFMQLLRDSLKTEEVEVVSKDSKEKKASESSRSVS